MTSPGHSVYGEIERAPRPIKPRAVARGYQSEQRTRPENSYFCDKVGSCSRVAIYITRTAFHFRWKAVYIFY